MEQTTTEIYTSMTSSLTQNDSHSFQGDITHLVECGEDMNNIVYFMIDYYSGHALSCDTDTINTLYMKLSHLHQLPKKKQRDVAMKQFTDIAITLNQKKSKKTNYMDKIGGVIPQNDIETMLSNHEHVTDFTQNDMLGALKSLLDQEKITYDMMRLMSCLIENMMDCNKRNVLKMLIFLCNQKNLKIGNIDYIELTQANVSTINKRDIVWYLWYFIIIKSKLHSSSVQSFVKAHFQLYSLSWSKKNKPLRMNMLCHVYALLSSSNVEKYIIQESSSSSRNNNEQTLSFEFLNCYTVFNKDLADTLERERREYTNKLKVNAKNVDAHAHVTADLPM